MVKTGFRLTPVLVLVFAWPADAQPAASQISHSGKGAYEASLTRVDDRFAVAWYDTRSDRAQIYLAFLDNQGRPIGSEHQVTSGTALAYEPDVHAAGADVAITWYEKAASGSTTAKLGVWSKEGRQRWVRSLSADGRNGRNPVVRAAGDVIFAAWLEYAADETPAVRGQWFDLEGAPQGAPIPIGPAGATTWNLNAALDAGRVAWVAFDAKAGTRSDEIFLARIDGRASRLTRLTGDDGVDSKYPDVDFSQGRVALTWFDKRYGNEEIYLFIAPAEDLGQDVERRARRITENGGESIGAYLAWNGGQLGLAWCDDSGGQHEIFVQRFNERGLPLEPPQQLTRTASSSLIPAIWPWQGGFALAWNEFTPGALGVHGPDGRSEVMFAIVAGARFR
jgi:hypothetical protein